MFRLFQRTTEEEKARSGILDSIASLSERQDMLDRRLRALAAPNGQSAIPDNRDHAIDLLVNIWNSGSKLTSYLRSENGTLIEALQFPASSVPTIGSLALNVVSVAGIGLIIFQLSQVQRHMQALGIALSENDFLAYTQTMKFAAEAIEQKDRNRMTANELSLRQALAREFGYVCRDVENIAATPGLLDKMNSFVFGSDEAEVLERLETRLAGLFSGMLLVSACKSMQSAKDGGRDTLLSFPIQRLEQALQKAGSKAPLLEELAVKLAQLRSQPLFNVQKELPRPIPIRFKNSEVREAIARAKAAPAKR